MSCIVTVDSDLSGLGISFWEADRHTLVPGARGILRGGTRNTIAGQRFCNNALQLSALLISERRLGLLSSLNVGVGNNVAKILGALQFC